MTPETISNQSPDTDHARATYGSSVVQLRLGLEASTIAIVASMLVVIGAAGVVMGLNLSKQEQMDRDFKDLKTQSWLTERRLMDDEAYRILNNQKVSGDDQYGPTGNLKRMVPTK